VKRIHSGGERRLVGIVDGMAQQEADVQFLQVQLDVCGTRIETIGADSRGR
jgi:hypothetical protein